MDSVGSVRKRPGMYIGDVADGAGLHQMLFEVLNNALIEAWAGHCDQIGIELNLDGSATVRDNGRGIPTEQVDGAPFPELVMTSLHNSGRFSMDRAGAPRELQGLGVVVVNALSEMLDLRIWRGGLEYHAGFRRGVLTSPLAVVGRASVSGTEIVFKPDGEIFASVAFDFDCMAAHVQSLAHLSLGAAVSLHDRRQAIPRSTSMRV